MNAEIFAEWLRRLGHTVIRTPSSYWYDAGPRVFQAFPYHWLIQPSAHELRRLLIDHGALALRYSVPLNAGTGMISYHVVRYGPYNLEMLRSHARQSVRRGLNNSQIERISFSRLAEEGWILQKDTLDRQRRVGSMSPSDWQQICHAAQSLPGFEAWGAIVGGELAASLLVARIGDTYDFIYSQSRREFLPKQVNNALVFEATCNILSRSGAHMIFCNLHSLDAPESVDQFKFRLGYVPKPVRQRVIFRPLLKPFANGIIHKLVMQLLHHCPASHVMAKAEGMLRFYLQGKRPLYKQDWPECLANRKIELLEALNFREESSDHGK